MAALDLENSPYATPLPRPNPPEGYSRHYAQRIRSMGQSSKDSWIKRLWHHMFQGSNAKNGEGESGKIKPITNGKSSEHHSPKAQSKSQSQSQSQSQSNQSRGEENSNKSANQNNKSQSTTLPPITANQKATNPQSTTASATKKEVRFDETQSASERDRGDGARSAPPRGRDRDREGGKDSATPTPTSGGKVIPPKLADSPYIPLRERTSYKVDRRSGERHHSERARRSKESPFIKKPGTHPYLSQHKDEWKPRLTRGVSMISLEKRAKSTAEKAMKEGKIFTCEGPYPLDTYVRLSLRRRGWVEKFGHKASGCTRSTADKIECEDDEDFEAIMDHYIPAPWEEDHGIYAIMSRIVRHYPAKFIWGGRNVNSMILKQEVIVNHFPKARYFSSKVGLSNSLKELPWLCSQDAHDFFPRCYTICEDEKEDIIEDFRLTTCLCLLKRVLTKYTKKRKKTEGEDEEGQEKMPRENSKYEEVTYQEDKEEATEAAKEEIEEKEEEKEEEEEETEETETETETESNVSKENIVDGDAELESVKTNEENEDKEDKEDLEEKDDKNKDNEEKKEKTDTISDEEKKESSDKDDDSDSTKEEQNEEQEQEQEQEESEDKEQDDDTDDKEKKEEETKKEKLKREETKDTLRGTSSRQKPKPTRGPMLKSNLPGARFVSKDRQQPQNFAPDLRKAKKKQLEIPTRAVDWALSQLNKFLLSKSHADLDGKSPRGITSAQWDQLIEWFYQVTNENATIPITESKLRECDEMLHRVKKQWPQCELDGDRNVWIVKPGDKSKGIGIEFVNKLDDIMKYMRDTASGCYVLQKYVERPLLVCKCKFDIRQWFLVTDWNPLTVWFYKESYLRICSQEFSYDTMHEAVHLSNVAVQQNYINADRHEKIPDDNFMPCSDFKELLAEFGEYCGWDDITYPGMKSAIVSVLLATQDVTETRKSAFELYGADFILTEDYHPWLLEINACPGMAPSSLQKAKLCAAVIDDTIKVVLDRRENKNCDTGNFELAFKDNPLPNTKCVETKFLLEGQRIRRNDLAKYNQIDQKMTRLDQQKEKKRLEKENGVAAKKVEVKEDKDEEKEYLSVNLYANGEEKSQEENEDKPPQEIRAKNPERDNSDVEERKSARDTDRSQKSSRGSKDKAPSATKRGTTSAKLDKIDQILKQSPYNNPKPPATEKPKKN